MTLSDPVANMLTIIRNANMRKYRTVSFPHSSFKWEICKKIQENNFFSKCFFDEEKKIIKVEIRYDNKTSRISELKKISTPSKHVHLRNEEIIKKCRGKRTYFISTSSGLMTNKEALENKVGGKVIFSIL